MSEILSWLKSLTFKWAGDVWNSQFLTSDKLYHAFGGIAIFLALHYWIGISIVVSVILAALAALIVEIIDAFISDGFSTKDLLATSAGAIAAAVLTVIPNPVRALVILGSLVLALAYLARQLQKRLKATKSTKSKSKKK